MNTEIENIQLATKAQRSYIAERFRPAGEVLSIVGIVGPAQERAPKTWQRMPVQKYRILQDVPRVQFKLLGNTYRVNGPATVMLNGVCVYHDGGMGPVTFRDGKWIDDLASIGDEVRRVKALVDRALAEQDQYDSWVRERRKASQLGVNVSQFPTAPQLTEPYEPHRSFSFESVEGRVLLIVLKVFGVLMVAGLIYLFCRQ